MKYLLLFSLLFVAPSGERKVYVCTGPQSECYHKKITCRGLKNCTGDVKQVSLSDAKGKLKRRACGYCYKRR